MSNVLSRGTNMPAEIAAGMINLVKGKSSLAVLSGAEPVAFNGTDYFTFNFDNEVSIIGENVAKVNGGLTAEPVTVRPYKFEYGARVSDEFLIGSEEYQMNVLSAFAEGFAKKAARGLDIGTFHGMNPRAGSASAVIGTNNFHSLVTQTVTTGGANVTVNDNVEAAIALIQDSEHDVTGMAMAPAFRSSLAQIIKSDGNPMFPELGWGRAPGAINGLPVQVNSTVAFGSGTKELAVLGNFEDYFKWGYAKDIEIEVIEYGNPDNDATAGDLKGHNQVYLRGECYIGWGILVPAAFARIVSA